MIESVYLIGVLLSEVVLRLAPATSFLYMLGYTQVGCGFYSSSFRVGPPRRVGACREAVDVAIELLSTNVHAEIGLVAPFMRVIARGRFFGRANQTILKLIHGILFSCFKLYVLHEYINPYRTTLCKAHATINMYHVVSRALRFKSSIPHP